MLGIPKTMFFLQSNKLAHSHYKVDLETGHKLKEDEENAKGARVVQDKRQIILVFI